MFPPPEFWARTAPGGVSYVSVINVFEWLTAGTELHRRPAGLAWRSQSQVSNKLRLSVEFPLIFEQITFITLGFAVVRIVCRRHKQYDL